jgi:hypothetical protein
MGRALRIDIGDEIYHVLNRANARMDQETVPDTFFFLQEKKWFNPKDITKKAGFHSATITCLKKATKLNYYGKENS